MALPTRIFLTGFMGSGKSTIGPILANVLGYAFVDLDEAIARQAGRPVQRIFAEEGEAAFRKLEREALRETGQREPIVVAVGGGALTVEENLQWALTNGVVIYLYVSLDDLIGRLIHGRTVRPLLLDDTGEVMLEAELREKVTDMMARREPFYRQAHLTVETGHLRVGRAVDAVARAVRRYRG